MHNLKRMKGSFKGIIGECMFKLTNRQVVITKFFNKRKYLKVFEKRFKEEQLKFIDENWFSIDAIEVGKEKGQITLYEIKTRNKYDIVLYNKPKMTLSIHNIYQKAKKKGFRTQIATVHLKNDWNYSVDLTEFDRRKYCIDKPKRYDKT